MSELSFLGPWSPQVVAAFLTEANVPVRLAFSAGDATPRVLPLWFVYEEERIWCAMQRSSFTSRCLERNNACGFEVSFERPPYRGVRGTANATLVADRGGAVLERCIEKYLGESDPALSNWLLSRAAEELAVCLEPRSVSSWDFRNRMADPGRDAAH
jgi:nitroimidazol reductase NimA-like FMN-containing flavoprotein (pyridoxamine 5'-phosphate oxidase superfamily)